MHCNHVKLLNILSFSALPLLVLFLLLSGAGIFPVTVCITCALVCCAASVRIFAGGSTQDGDKRSVRVPWLALAWLMVILFLSVSAAPLPGRLDAASGFRRYEQNTAVRSALSDAEELGIVSGVRPAFSITRNRSGTLRILVLAITVLGAAVLGASFSKVEELTFIRLLTAMLGLVAIAGILHQWVFPKAKTLWWFIEAAHGRPLGAFVNRTHHAGFLAMLCPGALVLLSLSVSRRNWVRALAYQSVFLIGSLGVVLSLSRGGAVALAISVLVTLILICRVYGSRVCLITCVSTIVVGAFGFLLLTGVARPGPREEVVERLQTMRDPLATESATTRLSMWKDSARLWADYAVLGVGANGFRAVFPQYRTRTDRRVFTHSENEYVELLTDGGLLGTLMMVLVVGLVASRWRGNVIAERTPKPVSLVVAGATIAVGVHNGVDFPLHVPLYTFVYASLLGLVLPGGEEKGVTRTVKIPRRLAVALIAVLGLLPIALFPFSGKDVYQMDSGDFLESADEEHLAAALVSSPTSWRAWYYMGSVACRKANAQFIEFGERCMTQASEYDPNNYRLWESLGHVRLNAGDERGAAAAFERMQALRPWKKPPVTTGEKY